MKHVPYQPGVAYQISHELRIPLTGILGVTHFLSQTTLTPQQQSYLQIIQDADDRLLLLEDKLPTILKVGN